MFLAVQGVWKVWNLEKKQKKKKRKNRLIGERNGLIYLVRVFYVYACKYVSYAWSKYCPIT